MAAAAASAAGRSGRLRTAIQPVLCSAISSRSLNCAQTTRDSNASSASQAASLPDFRSSCWHSGVASWRSIDRHENCRTASAMLFRLQIRCRMSDGRRASFQHGSIEHRAEPMLGKIAMRMSKPSGGRREVLYNSARCGRSGEGCSGRRRAIRPFRSGFGYATFAGHPRAGQGWRGLVRFRQAVGRIAAIRHHCAQDLPVCSPLGDQEG